LSDVVEFGIKFRDIEGLDRSFGEYRRLNPEISKVALVIDGAVQVASPPDSLGAEWRSDSSQYEYRIDLKKGNDATKRMLIVTVPRTVIYQTVLRSVKNFLALFVASAFLSGLFLQVGGSLRHTPAFGRTQTSHREDVSLVFIKPVFFLAVFFDSLTYSFLPKFMQQVAVSSHLSVGYASAPFTAYYLAFALSLIPAGTLCERYGPKFTTLVGMVFAAMGVIWLSFPVDIFGMTALRAAAGLGQGMILIGVQSYILKVVPPEKKTQGAGIIVFGFQAGLISGMALGSLLVNFLEANGVFMVAGGIAITALLYTALLVPEAAIEGAKSTLLGGIKTAAYEIKAVAKDLEFLNTLVCIGIPAKAVLTGVVTFAIPLVLGQYGYRSEDIGQIVMLYGLGVVVSSAYVSKIVDRTSNSGLVLLAGAVLSGTGLAIFGLLGSSWLGNGPASTVAISVAVTLVGVAHGFINAPVTTHVAHSQSAAQLGSSQVMTVYRFVERVGHVAGPIVLSQLFLFLGQGPHVVGAVGVVIALLGVAFVLNRSLGTRGGIQLERA
jgi:predicted MFS family arabinose efflux permease